MKAASVHLEVEGQSPSEVEGGGPIIGGGGTAALRGASGAMGGGDVAAAVSKTTATSCVAAIRMAGNHRFSKCTAASFQSQGIVCKHGSSPTPSKDK